MTDWPVYARIDGPIVMIGFGSIGKGTLPLIERHFSYDKSRFVVHRSRGQGPQGALRRARHPLHPAGADPRQLPRAADAAAHRKAAARASASTCRSTPSLGRHHGAVQRARRALHRHRQRAVARLLFRQARRARPRARTMRCARRRSPPSARASRARPRRCPAAAPIPAWCPGSSSRRCSMSRPTSSSTSRSRRPRANGPT